MTFAQVMAVYEGSKGEDTRALYAKLEALGTYGVIAMNVFRATKNSARAKVYRGRGYRNAAYERKQWAIDNLVAALMKHGDALGICWGWQEDPETPIYPWVLYIELPAGQVSFHGPARGNGPDFPSKWDGQRQQGPTRICNWCADLLAAAAQPQRRQA